VPFSIVPRILFSKHHVDILFVCDRAGVEINHDSAAQDELTGIMPPHESKSGVFYQLTVIYVPYFTGDRFYGDHASIPHLDAAQVGETFVAATIVSAEDTL
jgi:hypothetical protein